MSEFSDLPKIYYNEEELEGIRIEDGPVKKEVYASVERLRNTLHMLPEKDRQKLSEAIDRLEESFNKMEAKQIESLLLVGDVRK